MIKKIHITDIYAQYNPTRYNHYRMVSDSMKIMDSPHVEFINLIEKYGEKIDFKKTRYYKMHVLYGKSDKWIKSKIRSFIELYNKIKSNKEIDLPIVKQIDKHKYEIYEGHHRISCNVVLNKRNIDVEIIKNQKDVL